MVDVIEDENPAKDCDCGDNCTDDAQKCVLKVVMIMDSKTAFWGLINLFRLG